MSWDEIVQNLSEHWIVFLLGIIVVFLVLALLIGLIKLMGIASTSYDKNLSAKFENWKKSLKEKKLAKKEAKNSVADQAGKAIVRDNTVADTLLGGSGTEDEIAAVMAAINVIMSGQAEPQEKTVTFRVRSIKEIK